MNLSITKEKVLEAASKCSTAKETLKVLFPEVFEEDVSDLGELFTTKEIKTEYLEKFIGSVLNAWACEKIPGKGYREKSIHLLRHIQSLCH